MNLEDSVTPQDINITSTVKVTILQGREAKLTVPEELRLSPSVLQLLVQSLAAQGLELKHLDIAEAHRQDLQSIPNVHLEETPA